MLPGPLPSFPFSLSPLHPCPSSVSSIPLPSGSPPGCPSSPGLHGRGPFPKAEGLLPTPNCPSLCELNLCCCVLPPTGQRQEWLHLCPALAPIATGAFPSCPEPRPASHSPEGRLITPQLTVGCWGMALGLARMMEAGEGTNTSLWPGTNPEAQSKPSSLEGSGGILPPPERNGWAIPALCPIRLAFLFLRCSPWRSKTCHTLLYWSFCVGRVRRGSVTCPPSQSRAQAFLSPCQSPCCPQEGHQGRGGRLCMHTLAPGLPWG